MILSMLLIITTSCFVFSLLSVSTYIQGIEGSVINCSSHVECLNISNRSLCKDGLCACEIGYDFNVEKGCEKLFEVSKNCSSSEDCSDIENSYCSAQNRCKCLDTYKISDNNTCTRKDFPEIKCVFNQYCHEIIPNTQCDNSNHCYCEGVYENHTCIISNISQCNDSLECSLLLRDSQCIYGRCLCPINFIQVNDSFCLQRVSEKCYDNTTCQIMDQFSFCSDKNSCECSPGYYLSDLGACLMKKLGDTCQWNSDCENAVENSFCNKSCRCRLGYRQTTEYSCVQIHIGDSCDQTEDCSLSISNSYCHENLSSCYCNSGFVENDLSLFCNKLKIGNGECKNNQECLDAISNSYCNEDLVCQCSSGHAVTKDLDSCVRRRIGDRNCQLRTDCSDSILNGNCSTEGQCECNLGYYPNITDPYSCIRRILRDESYCTTDIDCSTVINNSHCVNHSCQCSLGFIGLDDRQHCRSRVLADKCEVDEDCGSVVPSSLCYEKLCACVSGFAELNNSTCQKRRIGDQNCLSDSDCHDAVKGGECRNVSNRVLRAEGNVTTEVEEDGVNMCLCRLGFYEQNNGTTCTLRQIGDSCSKDEDCSHAVNFAECGQKTSNCTCDYDHMVVYPDMTKCIDRPIIDQYKPDKVLRSFRKTYGCGRVFQYHKHTQQCPMAIPCMEGGKMRDIYRKQPHCQRSNAYVLRFNCSLIVGKYEHVPLRYNISFSYNKTSDSYWENALRISFYGVDQIMQEINSSFSKPSFHAVASRYFSSRVLHFEPMKDGIQAIVAIFFKLDKNSSEVDMETINNMVLNSLERQSGQIGLSKIFVSEPFKENFKIEDYDECETNSSYPAVLDLNMERNDCNQNAICANIHGFYQCVCDTSFVDKLEDIEFPGRTCTYKSDTFEFELLLSQKECTEENKCETPWSFVIFVTTIIFGLLFLLLAFETVWRMKQMSRSLDEKCRRQTTQLEMKLASLREQRRRNISRLLGRPMTDDDDDTINNFDNQDEVTQTDPPT